MLLHTLAGTRLQKIARGPSRPVTEYPWRRPGRMACLVAVPRRPLRPTWSTSLRAARSFAAELQPRLFATGVRLDVLFVDGELGIARPPDVR